MSTAVSESLRVVLDSNVLVSAFTHHRPGISFQIWEMAIERRYRISPAIASEAADVLRRKFSWGDEPILQRLKFLVRTGEMVVPKLKLQVVPDDDERQPNSGMRGRRARQPDRLGRSSPSEAEIVQRN